MATINGIEIFVEEESPKFSVTVTEYPVEEGEPIADHVKRELPSISVSGKLLGTDASEKRAKIRAMMESGETVSYVGRNAFANAVITSFDSGHNHRIANGMTFTMTLRQIRKIKQLFSPKIAAKLATTVKPTTTEGRKQVQTTKKTSGGAGGTSTGSVAGGKGAAKTASGNAAAGGTFAGGGAVVRKHTVRAGQTWTIIAATYNIPLATLRAANPQIAKYQRLKEGDVLTIG